MGFYESNIFSFNFYGIILCQNKVYHNAELGISFGYSGTDYNPYGLVYDSAKTKNLNNWNDFISKTVGISFKYPNGLVVKDSLLDGFYGESINDSSVYLGYNNTLNNSIFYPVVVIYKSNRNFEQIAEDFFSKRIQLNRILRGLFLAGKAYRRRQLISKVKTVRVYVGRLL